MKYRPEKLGIEKTKNGGFRIFDVDFETNELATILEFNPINSDLPVDMAINFAEYIIELYEKK